MDYYYKTQRLLWQRIIFDMTRFILCIFVQIASIFMLYFTLNSSAQRPYITFCYNYSHKSINGVDIVSKPPMISKIMAVAFASFLCVLIISYVINVHSGFYHRLQFAKFHFSFISTRTLYFGLFFHFILLVNVSIISVGRVYLTINALDIIFNFMAVLFIVNIDSIVITQRDYRRTLHWFQHKNNANWKAADIQDIGTCELVFFRSLVFISRGAYILFIFGLIVVPFFFIICY